MCIQSLAICAGSRGGWHGWTSFLHKRCYIRMCCLATFRLLALEPADSAQALSHSVSVKQHYTMRALWITFCACLMHSDAIRESVVGNATNLGDGADCTCGKKPLKDNTCCDSGLICSRTAGKCKPAVKGECESKWLGTNCAVSTYGRPNGISCRALLGVHLPFR